MSQLDVAERTGTSPRQRDPDAWREFLLRRAEANEESLRFVSNAILVVLGVLLSGSFLFSANAAIEGRPLSIWYLATDVGIVGLVAILYFMFKWAAPKISKVRNLALNLAQDLLEGQDVEDVSKKWKREFPRRRS